MMAGSPNSGVDIPIQVVSTSLTMPSLFLAHFYHFSWEAKLDISTTTASLAN
jgi:hypothetical protein